MLKSEKLLSKRDTSAHPASSLPAFEKISPRQVVATPAMVSGPRVVPASIASPVSSLPGSTVATGPEARSKLIVGPNIKLKGVEITDCDTLVVEGRVEATINARMIQIAERGAFIGNAEFDVAEIRGEFEGDLMVRQKLVVFSSGRVSGKVRYGKLVIEEGGQLSGDIQPSGASATGNSGNHAKGLMVAIDNG